MRALLGLAFIILGIELPSLRIRVATAAHRACDRLRVAATEVRATEARKVRPSSPGMRVAGGGQ